MGKQTPRLTEGFSWQSCALSVLEFTFGDLTNFLAQSEQVQKTGSMWASPKPLHVSFRGWKVPVYESHGISRIARKVVVGCFNFVSQDVIRSKGGKLRNCELRQKAAL